MERVDLFATPVHRVRHPDPEGLNPDLRAHLLALRARDPRGAGASNIGGWHSAPDLPSDGNPAVQRLHRWILAALRHAVADVAGCDPDALPGAWGCHGWAMIMERGAYSAIHDHADATWSCVYYVDPGDPGPPPGGRLTLVDPRVAVSGTRPLQLFPPTFSLEPSAGDLFLFPGWLRHQVFPYAGERPRISVSYNLFPVSPG